MKFKKGDWVKVSTEGQYVIFEILDTLPQPMDLNRYSVIYRYNNSDTDLIGYQTVWLQSSIEYSGKLLDEQSIKTFKMEQL